MGVKECCQVYTYRSCDHILQHCIYLQYICVVRIGPLLLGKALCYDDRTSATNLLMDDSPRNQQNHSRFCESTSSDLIII